MIETVASLRQEYGRAELSLASVHADPIDQFRQWFEECQRAAVPEPNAMTLCTVDPEGRPSGRMVLLKGLDGDGFTFFTNYESRKSRELFHSPHACLVFWWQQVERQVRIEGRTERLAAEVADEYFRTRPRESQLGAWASSQSRVIGSRAELESRFRVLEERFPDVVPRPDHWGGFLLRPHLMEFWQGRPGRLHDRIQYTVEGDNWRAVRLAP